MSRFRRQRMDDANRTHTNKYASSSVDRSMSAVAAAKRAAPRQDVTSSMRKICPVGWDYDNDNARRLGTDEKGYYMVPELSKVNVITPEMAEELYTLHNYDANRRFDQSHAERLSEQMVVAVQISIAIGPDNYPVVVNGQHTLWAIFMSGKDMQAQITVYMCRDNNAIAQLYGIFDSNKIRSAASILDAHRKSGSLTIEHSSIRHHRWSQAVSCAENDFAQPKNRVTNAEKADRASRPEVIQFANWIESHISGATAQSTRLAPMGIAACFYAMWCSDRVKADEFVKMYVTGIGLTENHPVLVLRNRLTVNKPEAEHGATASRLHAEIAYTCWNKFCRNEPLLSTRRTRALPKYDRWKIFVTPGEAAANEEEA